MAVNKFGFKVTKPSSLRSAKKADQTSKAVIEKTDVKKVTIREAANAQATSKFSVPRERSGNHVSRNRLGQVQNLRLHKKARDSTKMTGDLVTKVQKTVGFRSHDFLDTAELFLARLQNASCPDQGSPHAPIAISNDEQSENGSSISSRGCITADDKGDSDQIITDGDVTLPSTEPKDPRKRCLVKGRRYRVFRDGLYKLFAVKKPHVHQLPFAEVLTTVNEGLPAERRFTLLEAKQVLKYMEEKLFDSLCVDRITGVDLRDVELYA